MKNKLKDFVIALGGVFAIAGIILGVFVGGFLLFNLSIDEHEKLISESPEFIAMEKYSYDIVTSYWSQDLPYRFNEVYVRKTSKDEVYAVHEYEDTFWCEHYVSWRDKKNAEVEDAFSKARKNRKISDKMVPNFKGKYGYYILKEGKDRLYLVYVKSEKKIYMLESLDSEREEEDSIDEEYDYE